MGGCKRGDIERGEIEATETELESNLQSVDKAEAIVLQEAKKAGFDDEVQHQIGAAVREVVVNAVVHGNRYNRNKKVYLDIGRSKNKLSVTIGDEGSGFDPNAVADPLAPDNLLRQSGRGLLLARAFVDELDVHPRPGGGTEVRLVKNLVKS
jgi:serine/threonine-protein kinase RsbW